MRTLLFKGLATALLLFCSNACKDDELKCDRFFLVSASPASSANNSTFLNYNSEGLISSIVEGSSRLAFEYDTNSKLKLVSTSNNKRFQFLYDDQDRLSTMVIKNVDVLVDSAVLEYDALGRLAKNNIFIRLGSQVYYNRYVEMEYLDANRVKVYIYEKKNFTSTNFDLLSTTILTTDDKYRPFPDEYYLLQLALGNFVFSSNITSWNVEYANGNQVEIVFTYNYNSAGYPTERNMGGSIEFYNYSCTAPLE